MVSVPLRTILAAAGAAMLLLPAATQARPALRSGSVGSAAWSTDGRSIAWSQLVPHVGQEIWVARRDMTGANRVTHAIDALGKLAWLPGDRLVYEANFRLFTVDVRGGRTKLITRAGGESFVVDRRGDRIATGDPPCPTGCNGPVLVFDTRGRVVARVGGRAQNMSPTLSPAGARVAFDRNLCAKNGRCDTPSGIWTASVATGAMRRVTTSGVCADWSPDGRSIVYVDGLPATLRITPVRGGAPATLGRTQSCNVEFPPAWSRDSRSVAAVDSTGALTVYDARTRKVRTKTALSIGFVVGFDWSPDSSHLLVVGRRSAAACSDLWLVTVKTAAARRLRSCG
jgi:WD40 repeat protein